MKRFLSTLICCLLLVSMLPVQSLAAAYKEPEVAVNATVVDAAADAAVVAAPILPKDPAGSSVEPTTEGMEKAILAVKGKVTIPEEFSQFNYYFNDASSYSDAYWSFTWTKPSDYSTIQVNCDADYHITYYSKYDASKKTSGVSKYLKNELKEKADDFIRQIAPGLIAKLEYTGATFDGLYSGNYVYNYQRKENGIVLPDNEVTVKVNSINGEVTAASISWLYDKSLPSSKTAITKEEAAKLIKDNMKMKLVYRTNYVGIYDKFGNREATKAFLVYEPTQNYISVDAKSGEVYFDRSEWVTINDNNIGATKDEAASTAGMGSSVQALTEEELARIEELKSLISKDRAIDIVTSNPYLYLDKNLKSYSATLNKTEDSKGNSKYIWNIGLNDPREIDYQKDTDYYRAYASATVDAQTGKILSFYAGMKSYYDEKNHKWIQTDILYSKDEGRSILEKFLKSQIKDHFENSVLVGTNDDYVAYYAKDNVPVYGGYRYQYNRTNEGVEYPYNYISGSVDGVTGKIYSYSSNWDDNVVFESTKGVISADQAMDYYLANEGFGLKYEINVINKYDASYEALDSYYDYKDAYSVDYNVRLVYRPDVSPSYISPFTGEQLDYDGNVYKVTPPYSYVDIENIPENRNILLLADMNIGFEGDKFLPDQAITLGEMNKLLTAVGYGYGDTTTEENADHQITREEAAKNFIMKMNLEKVSKLAGIYKTGYEDEGTINADYVGAVALAKGLGLMTGDSYNNFNPKKNITRFEAVELIMNFINAQQNGIFY